MRPPCEDQASRCRMRLGAVSPSTVAWHALLSAGLFNGQLLAGPIHPDFSDILASPTQLLGSTIRTSSGERLAAATSASWLPSHRGVGFRCGAGSLSSGSWRVPRRCEQRVSADVSDGRFLRPNGDEKCRWWALGSGGVHHPLHGAVEAAACAAGFVIAQAVPNASSRGIVHAEMVSSHGRTSG